MKLPLWTVKPEWSGETVAILGGGPSLTQEQVDYCRGKCRVIAVNTSYWLAPWADLLYFCDQVWHCWHFGGTDNRGERHKPDPRYHEFRGIKAALSNACTHGVDSAVRILQNYGTGPGLCTLPDGVYTGRNSGFQAINLSFHLGASRVILLGFDMRAVEGRTHWHMAHKRPTPEQDFEREMLPLFQSLVEPCKGRMQILNATPGSAISCFPLVDLRTCLALGR